MGQNHWLFRLEVAVTVEWLAQNPADLTYHLLARHGLAPQSGDDRRRLLLCGESGSGKSTLAMALAQQAAKEDVPVYCLSADPGSPAFGVPGSVGLARYGSHGWTLLALDALCSLDAARFRLPLAQAVGRLAHHMNQGWLIIDTPGIVQGVAGAELLIALQEATAADGLLMLVDPAQPMPLAAEAESLPVPAYAAARSPLARHPGSLARREARTALWDRYLSDAIEQALDRQTLRVLGTPPPAQAHQAWIGRQIALLHQGDTQALGEILGCDERYLRIRYKTLSAGLNQRVPQQLLIRDAQRQDNCLLATSPRLRRPSLPAPLESKSANAGARRHSSGATLSLGPMSASLVNGTFGDPLLLVQFKNRKRCLLFDLGDLSRLQTQAVHRTTDVFITHAHLDHIFGFLAFLRARMGGYPACRLYGPPGLAAHLQAFLNGVHWDRIGDEGPRFLVGEVHPDEVRWHRLQAGHGVPTPDHAEPLVDGVLRREADFTVRVTTLEHGIPVLAFALTTPSSIHVEAEQLAALNIQPGPWVGEFKRRLLQDSDGLIDIPGLGQVAVRTLAETPGLIRREPGTTLAYATDFSGHAANRKRLARLAWHADALVCEASFMLRDEAQARSTGHLTTRDCIDIACAAQVKRLLPFHFSRRYEQTPQAPWQELSDRLSTKTGTALQLLAPSS